MVLASLLPVILVWLFFILNDLPIGFIDVVLNVFLEGPIFAYVSALIAPFLFFLSSVISGEKGKIKFGGVFFIISIVLVLLTTFLFYHKQISIMESKNKTEFNKKVLAIIPDVLIEEAKLELLRKPKEIDVKFIFTTQDYVALILYAFSLLLFYFSIYFNKKPDIDIAERERERASHLQEVIDEEFAK